VRDLANEMIVEVPDDVLEDNDFFEAMSAAVDAASDRTDWLIADTKLQADENGALEGFDIQGFNRHYQPRP
jgi:hypothetical protein